MTYFYPLQEEHQLSIWLCTYRDFFVVTRVRGAIFSYIFGLFYLWQFQNDKKYFLHSGKSIWDAVQKVTTVKILQKSTYFVTTEEGNLIPSHCSCIHCPVHKPLIKTEHSTLWIRIKGMENLYPEIFSKLGVPHIVSFFSFSFFHVFISA